jgi:hypothetical protein
MKRAQPKSRERRSAVAAAQGAPTAEDRNHAILPRLRDLFRVAQSYGDDFRKAALDPRLSPDYRPGQLFVLGLISREQLADGEWFAGVVGRWERLHGKRRSVASLVHEIGRGDATPPDDSEAGDIEQAYRALQGELDPYGARTRAALEQFWIEGRDVDPGGLAELVKVTTALRRRVRTGVKTAGAKKTKRRSAASPAPRPAAASASRRTGGSLRGDSGAPAADRAAWTAFMRNLQPAISDEELDSAWSVLQAFRARERFRRDKQGDA